MNILYSNEYENIIGSNKAKVRLINTYNLTWCFKIRSNKTVYVNNKLGLL